MLRAVIIAIILATLVATFITRSFIAPGVGAALLFVVILAAWLYNRGSSRASLRRTEEATRRQREERARGSE